MAHIDLYRAFGLDRHASPDDLWRTLTGRLENTDPADEALRSQIETARAILSDPGVKQAYDTRLADPAAPELDPTALSELASSSWGASPAVAAPAATTAGAPAAGTAAASSGGLLSIPILATIAVVLAVALAGFGWVVTRDDSGDEQTNNNAASASRAPESSGDAPAQQPADSGSAPAESVAPVPGAFPGAGGARPATAIPLPTYVSRYGKMKSAHLLTPTGGIGCDFQTAGSDGKQGQCGVRSMNTVHSPLGTERIGASIKGKWLFPFVNNRVGAPYGSTGTTGWMNQPANDGYQVPRAEYGKQYYFDDWVCASEKNGLTCWNTTSGSGIFLSNEKTETFDGPGGTAPASGGDEGAIVLGSMPSNGKGYGTEKPTEVYAGGSPTSRIYDITWSSWGGDRAEGTGTGTWREDGRVGREQYLPATVVVSDIGMCDGKRAYLKITWFFPSKGEKLGDREAMKTCWT